MNNQKMDIESTGTQREITSYFKPQSQSGSKPVFQPQQQAQPLFSTTPSYQPTLPQMQYSQFGQQAFQNLGGDFSNKTFGTQWRMKATENPYGGSGKDEMTSTSTSREYLKSVSQNTNLNQQQQLKVAGTLSMHRTDTDALVWEKDGEYHGHPGALRVEPNTTKWASQGHWTKDHQRADTAKTEFQALVDDPRTSTSFGDIQEGIKNANVRTGVETIRTMSMPYQQFASLGPSKTEVYHSKFGDIRDPVAHEQMAKYVHNARENEKWDTAAKMNIQGLHQHVPDVMQEYLKANGNDHHSAIDHFHKKVFDGSEKRINTATTSQADALDASETLKSTAGIKRSLSSPRLII